MSFKLSRRQFTIGSLAAGAAGALPAVTPSFAIGPFKGRSTVKQVFGHTAASLDQARRDLGLNRPASLSQMANRFVDDLVFDQPLTSRTALGGRHTLRIQRDGAFEYSGHFRATGFPSYDASVVTTLSYAIPNPGGAPAAGVIAFAAKGSVHGSNEPGDRQYNWNQKGTLPILASEWGSVRRGSFNRDFQYDVDAFGLAGDIAGFIGKLAAAGLTFGSGGAAIVLAGEVANAVDMRGLALPGIVGVIAAAGAYYVLGPGMLVPAFVAGAATAQALVKQNALSSADIALARQVFGDRVPYQRVRKTNLLGIGNRPFAMVSPIDDTILINLGDGFENSHAYIGSGPSGGTPGAPGQLLIHELAHAWQIAHSSWQPEFYCPAIPDAVDSDYAYGRPQTPWGQFGNEEQAAIVEEWYAGDVARKRASLTMNPGNYRRHTDNQTSCPPMATDGHKCGDAKPNPYYHYIIENIRAGRR